MTNEQRLAEIRERAAKATLPGPRVPCSSWGDVVFDWTPQHEGGLMDDLAERYVVFRSDKAAGGVISFGWYERTQGCDHWHANPSLRPVVKELLDRLAEVERLQAIIAKPAGNDDEMSRLSAAMRRCSEVQHPEVFWDACKYGRFDEAAKMILAALAASQRDGGGE